MLSPEIEEEMKVRRSLLDFLKKVLQTDPLKRLTPQQAASHPFITGNHASVEKCDELISLGKHIKKRPALEDDSSSNGSIDADEEEPFMLTGVRRKSFANKEPRSSTSVSPYTRKRYGSILSPLISPSLEKSPHHQSSSKSSPESSSIVQNNRLRHRERQQ
jgi:serine/threonine protein kinase